MLAGSRSKMASTTNILFSSLTRLGQNAPKSRILFRRQHSSAQFPMARPHFWRQTPSIPILSSATQVRRATTAATKAASPPTPNSTTTPTSLTNGLNDPLPTAPLTSASPSDQVDWSRSFQGLSDVSFGDDAIAVLLEPVATQDIEIKPDGIVYLPEIKYRRILNRAFGPGAWGLAPRGETIVTAKSVTREYGLVVQGRLVSIARGEQQYFDPEGIPTATEGCKSNALMRCCKDLGIASELWDPVFIRKFMADHSREVWVEHVVTKKKKRLIMRKDIKSVAYPFKESKA